VPAAFEILFANTGRSPEKIFPALAATRKKVVAFLNSNGIKDEDIAIGQWKMEDDPHQCGRPEK